MVDLILFIREFSGVNLKEAKNKANKKLPLIKSLLKEVKNEKLLKGEIIRVCEAEPHLIFYNYERANTLLDRIINNLKKEEKNEGC